jgi:hypothetical protein
MDRLTPIESADLERSAAWRPLPPRPTRRHFGPALWITALALVTVALGLDDLLVRRPAEEVRLDMIDRHEQIAARRRLIAEGITANDPAAVRLKHDYLSSAAWHEGRARAIREARDVDPVRERQADRANEELETRLDGLEIPSGSSY